ncbi:MAG: hypothetical protein LBD48_14225 [Treponema sp.]|nr:hypothetical protein [Treponema sp.]
MRTDRAIRGCASLRPRRSAVAASPPSYPLRVHIRPPAAAGLSRGAYPPLNPLGSAD